MLDLDDTLVRLVGNERSRYVSEADAAKGNILNSFPPLLLFSSEKVCSLISHIYRICINTLLLYEFSSFSSQKTERWSPGRADRVRGRVLGVGGQVL